MSSALKEKIFIETNNSKYCFQGYPSELSVNSFIEQKSFQKKSSLLYDQMFTKKTDFNPRAHRDDRQHSKFQGLNQAKQKANSNSPSPSYDTVLPSISQPRARSAVRGGCTTTACSTSTARSCCSTIPIRSQEYPGYYGTVGSGRLGTFSDRFLQTSSWKRSGIDRIFPVQFQSESGGKEPAGPCWNRRKVCRNREELYRNRLRFQRIQSPE
ncbi:unnamed protein product [Adineta ricciae]|uniref:Uncharacterized protein n=1 Tax=Adineta ricciae TaxID=249248 RepID=A0A815TSW6_ADIRI|nr:unnamed protein product [Adineta ricciae]